MHGICDARLDIPISEKAGGDRRIGPRCPAGCARSPRPPASRPANRSRGIKGTCRAAAAAWGCSATAPHGRIWCGLAPADSERPGAPLPAPTKTAGWPMPPGRHRHATRAGGGRPAAVQLRRAPDPTKTSPSPTKLAPSSSTFHRPAQDKLALIGFLIAPSLDAHRFSPFFGDVVFRHGFGSGQHRHAPGSCVVRSAAGKGNCWPRCMHEVMNLASSASLLPFLPSSSACTGRRPPCMSMTLCVLPTCY